MSNALTITGQMPVTPLIVLSSDVLSSVTRLSEAAQNAKITNEVESTNAAMMLREASLLERDIEKAREQVKAPFLEFGRKIDAAAKNETTKLQTGIRSLKTKLTAWQEEQDRLARIEAERIRKEQERLAREAAKAEADRKAAEEAARKAVEATDDDDDDDDLGALGAEIAVEQAQVKVEAIAAQTVTLAQTVVKPAAAPAGIHYRVTLKHLVTNARSLPPALTIVTPNDAEIRRLYCQGWKEGDSIPTIAGIQFTIDKQPIVRR